MASNTSPPKSGNASHLTVLAANFATTDLRTIASRPAFAPQRVDFKNDGATTQNAVFTPQGGASVTLPLSPGQTYPVDEMPVEAVTDTSGADVSAVCYWYNPSGHAINS